jgi:hypothetical protein
MYDSALESRVSRLLRPSLDDQERIELAQDTGVELVQNGLIELGERLIAATTRDAVYDALTFNWDLTKTAAEACEDLGWAPQDLHEEALHQHVGYDAPFANWTQRLRGYTYPLTWDSYLQIALLKPQLHMLIAPVARFSGFTIMEDGPVARFSGFTIMEDGDNVRFIVAWLKNSQRATLILRQAEIYPLFIETVHALIATVGEV